VVSPPSPSNRILSVLGTALHLQPVLLLLLLAGYCLPCLVYCQSLDTGLHLQFVVVLPLEASPADPGGSRANHRFKHRPASTSTTGASQHKQTHTHIVNGLADPSILSLEPYTFITFPPNEADGAHAETTDMQKGYSFVFFFVSLEGKVGSRHGCIDYSPPFEDLFRQVAEHTGCGAARGVGVSFLTNSQLVLLRALTRTISNIGVLCPLFTNNFFFFLFGFLSVNTHKFFTYWDLDMMHVK
jgi:hypothetical protein